MEAVTKNDSRPYLVLTAYLNSSRFQLYIISMETLEVVEVLPDSGDESDASSTGDMSRSFWTTQSLSSQNNLISYEPTQREQLKKGNIFNK